MDFTIRANLLNSSYLLALDPGKSMELSREHVEFWRTARRYVVGGDSLGAGTLSKTLELPVFILVAFGVIGITSVLLYKTGTSNAKEGPVSVLMQAGPQFVWVVFVVLLLANGFANAYKIANTTWGFRTLMRDQTQTINYANVKINEAIASELFNAQFGQEITEQLETCEALPTPTVRIPTAAVSIGAEELTREQRQTGDYISCLQTLKATVDRDYKLLQEQCKEDFSDCKLVEAKAAELSKEVGDGVKRIEKTFTLEDIGLPDLRNVPGIGRPITDIFITSDDLAAIGGAIRGAISSVGDFAHMELVELGNSIYTSIIELSFMLGGIFFPVTIAWSLIPGKRQVILDWFVTMLGIIISEQIYLILLGVVSVLSTLPQFHEFGPRLFLITLGISGPLLAGVGGFVSGFAMARTYRGVSAGAVGAAVSVVSAAAFTAMYRMNSRRQMRRA